MHHLLKTHTVILNNAPTNKLSSRPPGQKVQPREEAKLEELGIPNIGDRVISIGSGPEMTVTGFEVLENIVVVQTQWWEATKGGYILKEESFLPELLDVLPSSKVLYPQLEPKEYDVIICASCLGLLRPMLPDNVITVSSLSDGPNMRCCYCKENVPHKEARALHRNLYEKALTSKAEDRAKDEVIVCDRCLDQNGITIRGRVTNKRDVGKIMRCSLCDTNRGGEESRRLHVSVLLNLTRKRQLPIVTLIEQALKASNEDQQKLIISIQNQNLERTI